ncbi:hypothetical protein D3C78_1887150 [compost metagenome]
MYASDSAEERLELLQRELDDELEKLYDAMQKGNDDIVKSCKEKLTLIRIELLQLEW